MFIGYPRSSHSLMGAILDAHPHIVIPHEYHIVNRWSIYQDEALINTGMQKYLLFYNLHSLSTWQAVFGNRAKKPVFLDDGIYSYNVPGAWQGTFSGKIKVSTNAFIFYFFFQFLIKSCFYKLRNIINQRYFQDIQKEQEPSVSRTIWRKIDSIKYKNLLSQAR